VNGVSQSDIKASVPDNLGGSAYIEYDIQEGPDSGFEMNPGVGVEKCFFTESGIILMNGKDNLISEDIIFPFSILIFSVILSFIVFKLTKKYRVNKQTAPVLLGQKKLFPFTYMCSDFNIFLWFFLPVHFLILSIAGYFYLGLGYIHLALVVLELAISIFSVFFPLSFMLRNLDLKMFSIFRRIPIAVRIVLTILMLFASGAIRSYNIVY